MAKRKKLEKEKMILKYEIRHPGTIILAVFGFIGLIIFWKGLSNIIDRLDRLYFLDPVMLIFFGLVIIFLTGAMIKR